MSSSLKQARIESGKTLEEISHILKIRKQYLIALEEGDYDSIPGKVYVQGYLRLYANYLGISLDSGMEEEKQVLQNAVLQHKSDRLMISNHRWKRYVIIISILLLIIVSITYHLIL